jgi:Xaa-Pro aminopeptidase
MISEKEYQSRRVSLAKKMKSYSVGVIFSASSKIRSNDTEYPFRQNSNFYYLSGFKESNSCLLIVKKRKKFKSILFVEKKDKEKELWSGKRVGVDEAKKRFLFDEIYTIDLFESKFKEYLSDKLNLYYDFKLDYSKVKVLKRYSKNMPTHKNISLIIQKMRLIKSAAEIKLIKKAIDITKDAHHRVMSSKKISKYEYNLQASIEHSFKNRGAYSDAYTSIVACGNSANTLHYIDNDKALVDGELILIDAGCEYQYYCADITRTIPVNGKFTKAQKEIYNMVLDVQMKIIKMLKPDLKRSDIQAKSEELLCQGMIDLGILDGKLKKQLKRKAHKKYYPHGIGHWMGIDVHDQAPYKTAKGKEIALKEGMVLTIEPAIYCDKDDLSIPKKYRGIGIRIEDNILITKDGYENLSSKIVKTISDIEGLQHS